MDATLEDGKWTVNNLGAFDWKFFMRFHKISGDSPSFRLDHLYYLYYYASLLPEKATIVEIGTQHGESTIAMAMAIKENGGHIFTVDPALLSDIEKDQRKNDLNRYEVLSSSKSIVMENLHAADVEHIVTLLPEISENVLKNWDKKLDMVFVDGTHTYPAVFIDCQWMEHVKGGGLAVFDDWMAPVEVAVKDYLKGRQDWELITNSCNQPLGYPWKTVFLKVCERNLKAGWHSQGKE